MVSFDIDDMCMIESKNNITQLVCGKELNNGKTFNYDGDPNLAINNNSFSQKLLHEVDQGSVFFQDCGSWWLKFNLPNKWIKLSDSAYNEDYSTIIKRISPNNSEIFFRLNHKTSKTFKWQIEVVGNSMYKKFKLLSSVYNKAVLTNKYDSLGDDIDMDFNVYLDDEYIILEITNNENSTLLCTSKVINYN